MYSVPSTYNQGEQRPNFADVTVRGLPQYMDSVHGWATSKAIDLLKKDGYGRYAEIAEQYLLPMLEGVTFCDSWGSSGHDGSQLLHYYCPGRPDQDYGYGSVPLNMFFTHPTGDYAKHPFYGYANSASYAENRFNAAKRAYLHKWGQDPQDQMAGWVDKNIYLAGENGPLDGKYLVFPHEINKIRFGRGWTPHTALLELFRHYTDSEPVFPRLTDPLLAYFFVPKWEVIKDGEVWLDNNFHDADNIVSYCGIDNQGSAVYAIWSWEDALGCWPRPMFVRLPVNSPHHAFFLLGMALHLFQDATTPVHTIDSTIWTWAVHENVENIAEAAVKNAITWNGRGIGGLLPADTLDDFRTVYQWPPSKGDYTNPKIDPAADFKHRWYSDESAYDYVRNAALISNHYMCFIASITDTDLLHLGDMDSSWPVVGGFTALGLDLAVKGSAGLIRRFLDEVHAVAKSNPSSWLSVLLLED
jgi:hypothetical protein